MVVVDRALRLPCQDKFTPTKLLTIHPTLHLL
jgi:hypothetical protein